MHDQLVRAAPDARVRLAHCGAEIGIHRNRIVVHPPAVAAFEIPWRGESKLALPHGTLVFAAEPGNAALPRAALPDHDVVIRARSGGERVQLGQGAPTRALKRVLQEAGMPHWLRDSLPLVFCGEALAVVPGIGVAFAFHAAPGAAGYVVNWRPHAAGSLIGVKGGGPDPRTLAECNPLQPFAADPAFLRIASTAHVPRVATLLG
jgi:tRNA(Ile)-lysidine synthase